MKAYKKATIVKARFVKPKIVKSKSANINVQGRTISIGKKRKKSRRGKGSFGLDEALSRFAGQTGQKVG